MSDARRRRQRRRDVLAALGALIATGPHAQGRAAVSVPALPVSAKTPPAPGAVAPVVAFARGDVVVGCTLLNDARDDHKGRGRILHFDAALNLRNTIWLDDTTHIVQGMRFGPDRTLWAFDTFAYKIARFGPDGRRLPNFTAAPARSFGHVSFARDGRFYFGENYVGEKSRLPLRTTLPFMPGTKRLGEGHLFEFSTKGRLVQEFPTRTHGGMGGFQGLTSSVVSPDGRTVYYTSESGPTIFRYDVAGRRQLPDLVNFPENSGQFFFDVAFDRAGRLLAVRGQGVDLFDATSGQKLRSYPLGSFGWASMSVPTLGDHVFVSNFFSGEIARLDLTTGEVTARADAGIRRSLAGVAEFGG
jgi:sugar lactone lactonase YvrE